MKAPQPNQKQLKRNEHRNENRNIDCNENSARFQINVSKFFKPNENKAKIVYSASQTSNVYLKDLQQKARSKIILFSVNFRLRWGFRSIAQLQMSWNCFGANDKTIESNFKIYWAFSWCRCFWTPRTVRVRRHKWWSMWKHNGSVKRTFKRISNKILVLAQKHERDLVCPTFNGLAFINRLRQNKKKCQNATNCVCWPNEQLFTFFSVLLPII